jgi:murein DD-endopeptidase MepM/ murein hydrolase activator NlpD
MRQLAQAFKKATYFLLVSIIITSCTTSGPSGLFGKKTPHEQYGQRLTDAGLKETALGRLWFQAAEQSLGKPLSVTLPYKETGYFAADRPSAAGIRFAARRGQKLNINLSKKPLTGFDIYLDLWQPAQANDNKPKLLASADTLTATLEYEVKDDGSYQLRIQPELLKGGEYTLTISTGPSLAFPVTTKVKSNVGSFWGAGRDAGARKHEGIDIFAPKRTPVVAAAQGTVTGVNENNLGGKVVWLRPSNQDYTLYYAHLDEQIAQPGQQVQVGDTLGLVGNTGNAKTTAPHLHFGIYTSNGAVDPFPFVNPLIKSPVKITATTGSLNTYARTTKSFKLLDQPGNTSLAATNLEAGSILLIEAATADWYKVELPDGQKGFISANAITSIKEPIKKYTVPKSMTLTDAPNVDAPAIATLTAGEALNIVGNYGDYFYVRKGEKVEGWIPKKPL